MARITIYNRSSRHDFKVVDRGHNYTVYQANKNQTLTKAPYFCDPIKDVGCYQTKHHFLVTNFHIHKILHMCFSVVGLGDKSYGCLVYPQCCPRVGDDGSTRRGGKVYVGHRIRLVGKLSFICSMLISSSIRLTLLMPGLPTVLPTCWR